MRHLCTSFWVVNPSLSPVRGTWMWPICWCSMEPEWTTEFHGWLFNSCVGYVPGLSEDMCWCCCKSLQMCYGSEYLGPGHTALQLVANLYDEVTECMDQADDALSRSNQDRCVIHLFFMCSLLCVFENVLLWLIIYNFIGRCQMLGTLMTCMCATY